MSFAIPNKDAYVRIEGLSSGKVLAVTDNELCHAAKEPVKAEQWWQIVPMGDSSVATVLPGKKTAQYGIKNVMTGKFLWCRTKEPRAGAIDSNAKYPDNLFIFDETRMPGGSGSFRFFCPSTSCVLVSRTHRKPEIDAFQVKSDGSPDYEDHHFRFLFEESEIRIEYDTKSHHITNLEPLAFGRQVMHNLGTVPQNSTKTLTEDVEVEHSFENSEGYQVGAELGLKISPLPIPELIEGDVRITTTETKEWKRGERTVKRTSIGDTVTVTTPPGKTYIAQLLTMKGRVTVPYTITSVGRDSKAKSESKGVYTGVQYYNVEIVVYDEDDPDAKDVIWKSTKGHKNESRSYETEGQEREFENDENDGSQRFEESQGSGGYEQLEEYSERYENEQPYNFPERQERNSEADQYEQNRRQDNYDADADGEYTGEVQEENEPEIRPEEYEHDRTYGGGSVNEYRNADDRQAPAPYSGYDNTEASSFAEESSYDYDRQSRAYEDSECEERSSYTKAKRDSARFQHSDSYNDSFAEREERVASNGNAYGAESQYAAYDDAAYGTVDEGRDQRYEVPYRSNVGSSGW